MLKNPSSYLYTRTHEWIKVEGDIATVGVTDYAQRQMGDLVYLELPKCDATMQQNAVVGTLETVKVAADLFAPVSGTCLKQNTQLTAQPGLVNQDPLGEGWLYCLRIARKEELDVLLDSESYAAYLKTEEA